jgi:hypothetical protein
MLSCKMATLGLRSEPIFQLTLPCALHVSSYVLRRSEEDTVSYKGANLETGLHGWVSQEEHFW